MKSFAEIEDRIDVLSAFPEPAVAAAELLEMGEQVLEHWISGREQTPTKTNAKASVCSPCTARAPGASRVLMRAERLAVSWSIITIWSRLNRTIQRRATGSGWRRWSPIIFCCSSAARCRSNSWANFVARHGRSRPRRCRGIEERLNAGRSWVPPAR